MWTGGRDPEPLLRKMEGLLQKLRDTPPEHRPEQTTLVYLSTHLGCSVPTMRLRIADAEVCKRREDDADYFLELYYQLGNVLGESLAAKTFQIARDVNHRSALAAQKFLLPLIDPDTYGDKPQVVEAQESNTMIKDVPQEVWDAATELEQHQIDDIAMTIDNALKQLSNLAARLTKRVADKRVAEVDDAGL